MQIPSGVCAAYAIDPPTARHVPSLINDTFVAEAGLGQPKQRIVVQRLHPVFGREVHEDIEAVTRHLEARGMETPRLLRTLSGALDCTVDGDARPWRALSYVAGVTVHASRDEAQLRSAARLLARFHRALVDLDWQFKSQRRLHDTPRHIEALRESLATPEAQGDPEAQSLGADVLRHAEGIRTRFDEQPSRVIHGDPKLSNLLFFEHDATTARCMIDLDTVGPGALAFELGDAMRSWCNPSGEDAEGARLERPLVRAVLAGYLSEAPEDLGSREVGSIVEGLETVSCELASRFASDAIRDCYFGWNPERFASRREHNLVRARVQLALSRQVRVERDALLALAEETFSGAHGP